MREVPPEVVACAFKLAERQSFEPEMHKLLAQWPELTFVQSSVPSFPYIVTTLLYTAARAGNEVTVDALIRRGADPNLRVENKSKSSALHVACYRGHVGCVRRLLSSRHYTFDLDLRNALNERCDDVFESTVDAPTRATIKQLLSEYGTSGEPLSIEASTAGENCPDAAVRAWWWCGEGGTARPLAAAAGGEARVPTFLDAHGLALDDGTLNDDVSMPLSLRAMRDASGKLLAVDCRWFFLSDDSTWEPLLPSVCAQLDAITEAPKTIEVDILTASAGIQRYAMDPIALESTNVSSGRRRPLLTIGRGGAVHGSREARWALQRFKGAAYEALPPQTEKALNEALASGIATEVNAFTLDAVTSGSRNPTANIRVSVPRLCVGDALSVRLQLDASLDGASSGTQSAYVTPYRDSFLVASGTGVLRAVDPSDAAVLDLALATGHGVVRGHHYEWDLSYHTRTDVVDGAVSRLLIAKPLGDVRETGDGVAEGPFTQQAELPAVVATRLSAVLDGSRSADDIKAAIAGGRSSNSITVPCLLALLHILVHRFGFVVKGGVVADAVVRGVVAIKDIDAEMPRNVNMQNCTEWVVGLQKNLVSEWGCVASDSSDAITERTTRDLLSRVPVKRGLVTLKLAYPEVEIEMVPPWNVAFRPPRNVDFTVNNLRIEPPSPLRTGTAAGTGSRMATLTQSVPLGLRTSQIVEQICENIAMPVYDIVWTTNGELKVRDDVPPFRQKSMQKRLERMKEKGYTFQQLPY